MCEWRFLVFEWLSHESLYRMMLSNARTFTAQKDYLYVEESVYVSFMEFEHD